MLILVREVIYKSRVEMSSGSMIYIPSFIQIGSPIQKLTGGDTHTDTRQGDFISQLLLFQNKESRLNILNII
jgi:hypothetical protein